MSIRRSCRMLWANRQSTIIVVNIVSVQNLQFKIIGSFEGTEIFLANFVSKSFYVYLLIFEVLFNHQICDDLLCKQTSHSKSNSVKHCLQVLAEL